VKIVGWYRTFEENESASDIPGKVKRLEIRYWAWQLISLIIAGYGIKMIIVAGEGDLKAVALGLFVAIVGAISLSLIKIRAHIRLAMLWAVKTAEENKLKKDDKKTYPPLSA